MINDEKMGGFFLNCSYEGIGEKDQDSIEGCLSLRNKIGQLRKFSVKRYNRIHVKGKKLVAQNGDPQLFVQDLDIELNGFFSIVFQHEIDHANQILISNLGAEVHIW